MKKDQTPLVSGLSCRLLSMFWSRQYHLSSSSLPLFYPLPSLLSNFLDYFDMCWNFDAYSVIARCLD